MHAAFRLVNMALIDQPTLAMRVDMDEGKLAELQSSMAAIGLESPIGLRREGERWRIIYGHRRYVAAKRLGWVEVIARDYTESTESDETIKAHENLMRQDVNDAELALYMVELIERDGADLDRLKAMTGKPESWIAARCALFRGDKEIFDAVLRGDLKLNVATELNKFPDSHRHMFTVQALASGCKASVVHNWLNDLKLQLAIPQGEQAPPPEQIAHQVDTIVQPLTCALCDGTTEAWTMVAVFVHKRELDAIKQAIAQGNIGG